MTSRPGNPSRNHNAIGDGVTDEVYQWPMRSHTAPTQQTNLTETLNSAATIKVFRIRSTFSIDHLKIDLMIQEVRSLHPEVQEPSPLSTTTTHTRYQTIIPLYSGTQATWFSIWTDQSFFPSRASLTFMLTEVQARV